MAGIPVGSLPIRYLGLPLTTRSMTSVDYAPLIYQIRTRLLSWASRHLSFAGRLQLIKAVISSIANFWCSVFRLPKRYLSEIERMCSNFLWSGTPNNHSKAKVKRKEVCYPTSEGGLGIRSLTLTSRVFAFHLIWRFVSPSRSLWVNWVRRHLLRNHTFRSVPLTSLGSWIWRKLVKLRDSIGDFICGDLRNGRALSFWHDSWLPQGPLIKSTGENDPRILGIPLAATVKEATAGSGWQL